MCHLFLLWLLNHRLTAARAHGVTGGNPPAVQFGRLVRRQEVDLLTLTTTNTDEGHLLHMKLLIGYARSRPRTRKARQDSAAGSEVI